MSEREECPPNPPTIFENGAPVPYLLIPVIPAFHLSGDGQSISGSYSEGADSWEWNLTRVER